MEVAINSHTDGCGNSGMPMDCCTDDIQIFALDDEFQLDQQTIVLHTPVAVLYEISEVIDANLILFELRNGEMFTPPLIEQDQDIFVRVQSFLL